MSLTVVEQPSSNDVQQMVVVAFLVNGGMGKYVPGQLSNFQHRYLIWMTIYTTPYNSYSISLGATRWPCSSQLPKKCRMSFSIYISGVH